MDHRGALCGTTEGGGVTGSGTVFKRTAPMIAGGAWTETVLHSFTGADGILPVADLLMDYTGALYGTTSFGGGAGFGTVFRLTPPTITNGHWTETVLHRFAGPDDGRSPAGGLVMDERGALCGTAEFGGAFGEGMVFKLTPPTITGGPWAETVLHSFTGLADGGKPAAALLADHRGALFGTTDSGGAGGTVFCLSSVRRPGAPGMMDEFDDGTTPDPHDRQKACGTPDRE